MTDLTNIESRLRAVEDQLEIQGLAARFSDAVNERNVEVFRGLWMSNRPVWEIGSPLQSRAEGLDEIVALLRRLMQAEQYFMQMTHSGVIEIKGDQATARFVMRERGRGESTYYDNLAVYEDVLVREAGGWRFAKRSYRYRFLDQNPFGGDAFPIT
jgi:SnoaL-like domain